VDRIAPKAEILSAREEIKSFLTSATYLTIPHALGANQVSVKLRRK
jgi:hypothetical protein